MKSQRSITARAPGNAFDDVRVVATIATLAASLVASPHGVPDPVEDAEIVREQGRVVASDRGASITPLAVPDHAGVILAHNGRVSEQMPHHFHRPLDREWGRFAQLAR